MLIFGLEIDLESNSNLERSHRLQTVGVHALASVAKCFS